MAELRNDLLNRRNAEIRHLGSILDESKVVLNVGSHPKGYGGTFDPVTKRIDVFDAQPALRGTERYQKNLVNLGHETRHFGDVGRTMSLLEGEARAFVVEAKLGSPRMLNLPGGVWRPVGTIQDARKLVVLDGRYIDLYKGRGGGSFLPSEMDFLIIAR